MEAVNKSLLITNLYTFSKSGHKNTLFLTAYKYVTVI